METAKAELGRFVDLLSEEECRTLSPLFRDVAEGERFWEGDIAAFYNESVKARPVVARRGVKPGGNEAPRPLDGKDLFVPIPVAKHVPFARAEELPEAPGLPLPLGEALERRRSRRRFTGERATLRQLSALLHHAAGVNDHTVAYGFTRLPRRRFPTSGGLQSPELYVIAQNVEDVEPGLYHYAPEPHRLEQMREGDLAGFVGEHTFGQAFVESAVVNLVVTGVYDRLRWKYGERAYRYMCMDAGFLAQNLYLVSEALGLGACAIAGFYDEDFEKLLELDPPEEMVLLLFSVGVPSEDEQVR